MQPTVRRASGHEAGVGRSAQRGGLVGDLDGGGRLLVTLVLTTAHTVMAIMRWPYRVAALTDPTSVASTRWSSGPIHVRANIDVARMDPAPHIPDSNLGDAVAA
ncbi:hypothetical protein GCM10020216_109160 [Nonomuraea helvata]